MATRLTKPVRRVITILLDYRERALPRDEYTVTLYPDGTIGFRAKRRRKEHTVTLAECLKLAYLKEDEAKRKEKRAKTNRRPKLKRSNIR